MAQDPANSDILPKTSQTGHVWNLNHADITNVIEAVSKETGKNFVVDPRVNGKISIVSAQPMSSEEVYQVFLSMLQVLGYTAVPEGSVIKIQPRNDAKGLSYPSTKGSTGNEMAVQTVHIQQTSATKMLPALRPLIPDNTHVIAYEPSNTLIVSGNANTIKRVVALIHEIDHNESAQAEIITLHRADAANTLNVLTSLQANNPELKNSLSFAADEHTNSIILSGEKSARMRAKKLILQLDSSDAKNAQHTQVFELHYLKAKELAPVLTKVAHGNETDENSKTSSGNNKVSIQAELTTNSLIITAPPSMMKTLRTVIERLDARPSQVLVEAAIVEVNEAALKQIGVLWGELIKRGRAFDITESVSLGNGFPLGFHPGVGVIKNGNLREIIHLLANDASTNILSTPSIMVVDNQQAKIEVGKTLSIETGEYSNTNGNTSSVNPFITFSRENIGLHLYVTPQINRGDAVQLIIDQGNQTLENPVDPSTTPVTNNTSLKTTVLVSNKDILILGGLISNDLSKNTTKIPVLGDLPAIGDFFTYRTKRMQKKNLMIFIKPTIIKRNSDTVSQDRYTYMRNQQIEWENNDNTQFPPVQSRILPPLLKNEVVLPKPFVSESVP